MAHIEHSKQQTDAVPSKKTSKPVAASSPRVPDAVKTTPLKKTAKKSPAKLSGPKKAAVEKVPA